MEEDDREELVDDSEKVSLQMGVMYIHCSATELKGHILLCSNVASKADRSALVAQIF